MIYVYEFSQSWLFYCMVTNSQEKMATSKFPHFQLRTICIIYDAVEKFKFSGSYCTLCTPQITITQHCDQFRLGEFLFFFLFGEHTYIPRTDIVNFLLYPFFLFVLVIESSFQLLFGHMVLQPEIRFSASLELDLAI